MTMIERVRWSWFASVVIAFGVIATGCGRSGGPTQQLEAQPMTPRLERLLQQGSEALRRHEFTRAFALADSAELVAPDLADVPFLRARIYSELARLDVADSLYRRVLEIRPDYPGAWHNLGNTAFRQQRYSEAISSYRREFDAHGDAQPWRGIGRAYVELGKTDSARIAFERAISVDSTLHQAHFSLALLLEDLGDLEGALASAGRALALDPDNHEYRYYAASYLVRLGRPVEAVEPLAKVIDEWPWHQGANYNMAQALIRTGRTREGRAFQDRAEKLRDLQAQISHHENTVRVQPTNAHAHAGLGTLLRRAGRYNDAMHAYQVALFLEPANLEYRNNLAVLHLLRRDTTVAIRVLEEILRADSTNINTWINLGSLYALSGDKARARAALLTALRMDPGNQMAEGSLRKLESGG